MSPLRCFFLLLTICLSFSWSFNFTLLFSCLFPKLSFIFLQWSIHNKNYTMNLVNLLITKQESTCNSIFSFLPPFLSVLLPPFDQYNTLQQRVVVVFLSAVPFFRGHHNEQTSHKSYGNCFTSDAIPDTTWAWIQCLRITRPQHWPPSPLTNETNKLCFCLFFLVIQCTNTYQKENLAAQLFKGSYSFN